MVFRKLLLCLWWIQRREPLCHAWPGHLPAFRQKGACFLSCCSGLALSRENQWSCALQGPHAPVKPLIKQRFRKATFKNFAIAGKKKKRTHYNIENLGFSPSDMTRVTCLSPAVDPVLGSSMSVEPPVGHLVYPPMHPCHSPPLSQGRPHRRAAGRARGCQPGHEADHHRDPGAGPHTGESKLCAHLQGNHSSQSECGQAPQVAFQFFA